MHQSKKWKQSIRCGGKTLGEWLAECGYDTSPASPDSSQKCTRQHDSQKCTQQPRNVQTKDVVVPSTSTCTQLNVSEEEDNQVHNDITGIGDHITIPARQWYTNV